MLESLKKKTLLGNLWCIIVLGIVTATLGVLFGSGIVKMLAGPAYFEPLDDHEDILSLQGQYITMDVDTLIDYYAETVRSESGKRDEVSAREYIMPINTRVQPFTSVWKCPRPKSTTRGDRRRHRAHAGRRGWQLRVGRLLHDRARHPEADGR